MTAEQLVKKLIEERDMAIGQLQSLGLQLGQNTDKAKDALDKQEPMNPKAGWAIVLHDVRKAAFMCPICGRGLCKNQKHCDECGQKIDWNGVEEGWRTVMYEAPIKVIQQQMETQLENDIFKAIVRYDIDVDKEELLKALKYDRDQYGKGYDEGYRKGIEDFIDRIREPIIALDNGMICLNDHKCAELTLCVDCKVHRVKKIIVTARESMVGGEE